MAGAEVVTCGPSVISPAAEDGVWLNPEATRSPATKKGSPAASSFFAAERPKRLG